jgi:Domain of unknown function (DUF4926)
MKYQLFMQVALAQDIPELGLKKGCIGTIVEFYSMSDGEDAGYSLEGLIPGDTVEVAESQLEAIAMPLREIRQAG